MDKHIRRIKYASFKYSGCLTWFLVPLLPKPQLRVHFHEVVQQRLLGVPKEAQSQGILFVGFEAFQTPDIVSPYHRRQLAQQFGADVGQLDLIQLQGRQFLIPNQIFDDPFGSGHRRILGKAEKIGFPARVRNRASVSPHYLHFW